MKNMAGGVMGGVGGAVGGVGGILGGGVDKVKTSRPLLDPARSPSSHCFPPHTPTPPHPRSYLVRWHSPSSSSARA